MQFSRLKALAISSAFIFLSAIGVDADAQNYRLPGQHTEQSENLLAKQNSTSPNVLDSTSIDYYNYEE